MATVYSMVTDRAEPPVQDPAEITQDSMQEAGVTATAQMGATEEFPSSSVYPVMGVAGTLVEIDDATFVDPGNGLMHDHSRFFPGHPYAVGYENEAPKGLSVPTVAKRKPRRKAKK